MASSGKVFEDRKGVTTVAVTDFTHMPKKHKAYAGANGSKISVIYEGEQYMLKFPTIAKKNKGMSYSRCV